MADEPICIGDYVTLYASKPNEGWLGFDGLCGSNCFLSSNPSNFEDCLWQVYIQHQYSAVNEYEERLYNPDSMQLERGIDPEETKRQLFKAALNEIRLNEKLMTLKIGKPIAFGDTIQLVHVKSGKFLTVNSHLLAKVEKENMQVSIAQRGNVLSYLSFSPRYKMEKEGQQILNNSDAYMRVVERPGEFIHAAKKSLNLDGEVNCSLDSTSWQISVYYRYNSISDESQDALLGGQLISLQDVSSDSQGGCIIADQTQRDGDSADVVLSTDYQMANEENLNQKAGASHLLWVIEKEKLSDGSNIKLGEDLVTLRHLNSNMYLKEEDGKLNVVMHRENASYFTFHNATPEGSNRLKQNMSIYITQGETWISSTEDHYCDCSVENMTDAIAFRISRGKSKLFGNDLYYGVEAAQYLRNFLKLSKLLKPSGGNFNYDLYSNFGLCKGGLKETFQYLDNLYSIFLNVSNDPGSFDTYLNKSISKEVNEIRQILFQEQGVIDVILDLIEFASKKYFDKVNLKRQTVNALSGQNQGNASNYSLQKNPKMKQKTIIKKKEKANHLSSSLTSDSQKNESSSLTQMFSQMMRRESISAAAGNKGFTGGRRNSYIKISPDSLMGNVSDQDRSDLDAQVFNTNSSEINLADSPSSALSYSTFSRSQRSTTLSKSRSNSNAFLSHKKIVNDTTTTNSDEQVSLTLSEELIYKLFTILLELIRGNFDNQLKVSGRLHVLIHHINSQDLAVDCLHEILYNNLQILHSSVNQREINLLLDLLSESKLNVLYVRLLSILCRAPMGVDSTQRMIATTLFKHLDQSAVFGAQSKYKGLTFNLTSDYESGAVSHQLWPNAHIYFPADTNFTRSGVEILGYNLYSDGLPRLAVNWEYDANMLNLDLYDDYGVRGVDLATICDLSSVLENVKEKKKEAKQAAAAAVAHVPTPSGTASHHGRHSIRLNKPSSLHVLDVKSDKKTELKVKIYEYIIAQLYLVADLCLDRNYISINILKKGYNLDTLLAVLKQEHIAYEMKAPICRIIRNMYIDRDPQVTMKYPRLVRTASSVLKNAEKVDDQTKYSFAILQCIISEYLHKHSSSRAFNEYSMEITESLNDLIKFGFYLKTDHIQDIITPLLKYLHPKEDSMSSQIATDESQLFYHEWLREAGVLFDNWEAQYLAFQDNISGMVFFLVIVVITVSIAIIQMSITVSLDAQVQFDQFDFSVSIFFLTDIVLRIYCHVRVNLNIFPFFRVFYNLIDFVLVVLDMILLGLGTQNSLVNSGRFFRFFKIIRLLRLFRLLRAARLVKNLADKTAMVQEWKIPLRYVHANKAELETKINIISILSKIYDRIFDNKLEYLVQSFVKWKENEKSGNQNESLDTIANNVIHYISANIYSSTDSLDELLFDAIMFSNTSLIKESLNLLMIHNSKSKILDLADHVQIIYSPSVLSVYETLGCNLRDFKSLGEMFELWGNFETHDYQEKGLRMMNCVDCVLGYVRRINDNQTLDIKSKYIVDADVQIFLLNLGFMETAMNSMEALYDGGREAPQNLIIDLMLKICDLICWFVRDNSKNQIECYKHFDWFLKRMDDLPEIQSSRVIRECLRSNRDLVKQFPRQMVGEMAMNIRNKGHNPDYLDMYLGLVGYEANLDNRYLPIEQEIAKFMSGKAWKGWVLLYCSGGGGGGAPGSTGYSKRKSLMEIYVNESLSHYELHSELRYHISLIKVLARCRLGPKLQAIYNCDDILTALIDPSTIILVKIPLLHLLYDYLVSDINIVKSSEFIWPFFENVAKYLEESVATIPILLTRSDKDSLNIKLNTSSLLSVLVKTLDEFFSVFNFTSFNSDLDANADMQTRKIRRSDEQILEILKSMAIQLNSIYKIKNLGPNLAESIADVIEVLIAAMKTDSTFQDEQDISEKYSIRQHKSVSLDKDDTNSSKITDENDASEMKNAPGQFIHAMSGLRPSNRSLSETNHLYDKHQFEKFKSAIVNHFNFFELSNSVQLTSIFERVPSVKELHITSDVRIEPLISKITSFIKTHIKKTVTSSSLDPEIFEISKWYLTTLRELLEKNLNLTLDIKTYHLNIPDSIPASYEKYRKILSDNGVVSLCIELSCNGIHPSISVEAMKLLILLLSKPGGCPEIQRLVHGYLSNSDSTIFMDYIVDTIEEVKVWVQKSTESKSFHRDGKSEIPNAILVFFLMQALCDGTDLSMSNYFREQAGNYKHIKIIETLSGFADYLSRYENYICTHVSIHVLSTIKKLIRGPCERNQEEFVIKTELLVSLNRYIRLSKPSGDSSSKNWNNALETLRECIVEILIASISGQSKNSVIFDKITTSIEFPVFGMILLPTEQEMEEKTKSMIMSTNNSGIQTGGASGVLSDVLNYKFSNLQSLYLVFLNSLGDDFVLPPPRGHLPPHISTREVFKIDIFLRDKIESVSFYIPKILTDNIINIEKFSEHLISHNDESGDETHEDSLKRLMIFCRQYYKEALHQHFLQKFSIPNVAWLNYYTTWCMFANAIIMNIMMMMFFKTHELYDDHQGSGYGQYDDHGTVHDDNLYPAYSPTYSPTTYPTYSPSDAPTYYPTLSAVQNDDKYQQYHIVSIYHDEVFLSDDTASVILSVLNILQVFFVIVVIATILINNIPISYSVLRETGNSAIMSTIYVLFEPLLLWYFAYLLFTLVAIKYHKLFLSILLLDWIVLDSTTRDVLQAVKNPARQLFATLIIIMILLNMFAGVVFYFYRADVVSFDIGTMWESLKLCISYGIRGEYGISHEMYNTLGERIILDLVFYFIIMAILRHIFFAIIVDTFSKLREQKYEHHMHAINRCFICGIERHEFEKQNTNVQITSFSTHRKHIHNPESYFYYMVNIWEQSLNDDSGLDSYVRKCLELGDISWLPIGISSDLQVGDSSHNGHKYTSKSIEGQGEHASSLVFENSTNKSERDLLQKLHFVQNQVTKLVSDKPTKGSSIDDDYLTNDVQKQISQIVLSLSSLQNEIKELSAKVNATASSQINNSSSSVVGTIKSQTIIAANSSTNNRLVRPSMLVKPGLPAGLSLNLARASSTFSHNSKESKDSKDSKDDDVEDDDDDNEEDDE